MYASCGGCSNNWNRPRVAPGLLISSTQALRTPRFPGIYSLFQLCNFGQMFYLLTLKDGKEGTGECHTISIISERFLDTVVDFRHALPFEDYFQGVGRVLPAVLVYQKCTLKYLYNMYM